MPEGRTRVRALTFFLLMYIPLLCFALLCRSLLLFCAASACGSFTYLYSAPFKPKVSCQPSAVPRNIATCNDLSTAHYTPARVRNNNAQYGMYVYIMCILLFSSKNCAAFNSIQTIERKKLAQRVCPWNNFFLTSFSICMRFIFILLRRFQKRKNFFVSQHFIYQQASCA